MIRSSTARSLIVVLCLNAAAVYAQSATQPAGGTSQPATAPADNLEPAVAAILDRLEAKGDQIRDIQADIAYVKIDPVLEDRQEYQGVLCFKQIKPNPKFMIRFDTFKQENITRQEKQWHAFDGQWYIETREKSNVITKRQIVRPGETLDVFKLGQGPFPLPFGQKREDIVRHFTVKLAPPAPNDPAGTDHLACTPRPGSSMAEQFDTVHFYIDRKLDLPVRIHTRDKHEGNEIIAQFSNVRINAGIADADLELPAMPDKQIDTIPLPADQPPPSPTKP